MTPRFFLAKEIVSGQIIELDVDAAHHASRVLRLKHGDTVTVFNGTGGEFRAHIQNISKTSLTAAVEEFTAIERESSLNIGVVQALCANEKMDWIIQKSVELGVNRIQPVTTTRSIVRLSRERAAKRQLHWQKVIISACEQCRRNRIPEILPLVALDNWLSSRPNTPSPQLDCVLSISGNQRLNTLPTPAADTPVTLAVGPEGGWSEAEEDMLLQNGFLALRVGERILRTETAALATIAAMQTCWGDF